MKLTVLVLVVMFITAIATVWWLIRIVDRTIDPDKDLGHKFLRAFRRD